MYVGRRSSTEQTLASKRGAASVKKRIRFTDLGEQWPDDGIQTRRIDVVGQHDRRKDAVVIALLALGCVLVMMFAIHAMVTGNETRLGQLLTFAMRALYGLGAWAVGHAFLKVWSGWKDGS